jgi:hypothetical protein
MPGWSIPTTPSGTTRLSRRKRPANACVPVCSVATVPSVSTVVEKKLLAPATASSDSFSCVSFLSWFRNPPTLSVTAAAELFTTLNGVSRCPGRNARATFAVLAVGKIRTPNAHVSVCSVSSVVEKKRYSAPAVHSLRQLPAAILFRVFRFFRGSGIPRPLCHSRC